LKATAGHRMHRKCFIRNILFLRLHEKRKREEEKYISQTGFYSINIL
jgi:hypothetical protein